MTCTGRFGQGLSALAPRTNGAAAIPASIARRETLLPDIAPSDFNVSSWPEGDVLIKTDLG
jgi:hypothetical protein